MAFTYADPSNSNLEAVRFLIGDTDSAKAQLTDAEINYLLTESGSDVYLSASSACLSLASKYARMVDKEVGDLALDYSQRQKAYIELSKELKRQMARKKSPNIFCGGLTTAGKETYTDNTALVQPTFYRDITTDEGEVDVD